MIVDQLLFVFYFKRITNPKCVQYFYSNVKLTV